MDNIWEFLYQFNDPNRTFAVFNVNNRAMTGVSVKIIPAFSVVSSVVLEGKWHNTQCARLVCVSSASIDHLHTFLWYGNMTNRQTDQKAPRTLLQSKQDPSWWSEMQIHSLFMQMRSRAAEQDGAARRHVRLQNSASFQATSSDVKQTQSVCDWQPPV